MLFYELDDKRGGVCLGAVLVDLLARSEEVLVAEEVAQGGGFVLEGLVDEFVHVDVEDIIVVGNVSEKICDSLFYDGVCLLKLVVDDIHPLRE